MKRRNFITNLALAGSGLPVIATSTLSSCSDSKKKILTPEDIGMFSFSKQAPDGEPVRAALIGCGDRGTGAATQFLSSGLGVSITALADVFPDRQNLCRSLLLEKFSNTIADSRCFIGFDAYKKSLNYLILTLFYFVLHSIFALNILLLQ